MPDQQLPLFGKLGYGYDIVTCQSKNPVFEPVYGRQSGFTFRGTQYAVPDGVTVEPGPASVVISTAGMVIQKQIYDVQTSMGMSVGVKVDSFGEFSQSQKVEDRLSVFNNSLKYFSDVSGSFSFFRMRLQEALEERVLDEQFVNDARTCTDDAAFRDFVQTYGTHVVSEGSIGGELQISVELDVQQMKQQLVSGQTLGAQVSAEIEDIPIDASAELEFRSTRTDENYRSYSRRKILKVGGDVTARTLNGWYDSLRDARLPEVQRAAVPVTIDGPRRTTVESQEHENLAFTVARLQPVSLLLARVDKEAAAALDARIRQFVAANRIDNSALRSFDPFVGGGGGQQIVMPGGSYHCGAWAVATTGIKFGLKAAPGVRAEVRIWHPLCKEQTVPLWAGETHDASGFFGPGNLWIYFDCDDRSARLKLHVW